MKNQTGYIFKVGRSWYGRWYQDELVHAKDLTGKEREKLALAPDFGGMVTVRRQHCEKLCEVSDQYRTKKDVKPVLAAKLKPINEDRAMPEGTLTVKQYTAKFFLPYAASELKASTSHGYKGLWRMYVAPNVEDVPMRNFRCVHATKTLAAIYQRHGLNRKSLRNCKGLLSSIFAHALQNGAIDGLNPIQSAGIPRAAEVAKPTHAYSTQEVTAMLNALTGTARTAVALMFFCGLRPGEARGARWADYDEQAGRLQVRVSVWRKIESAPKTEESIGEVPVGSTLTKILAETERTSEFILATPSGKPVDLHNLAARVIVPRLERCAVCDKSEHNEGAAGHSFAKLPAWRGFYALRRGLGTTATTVEADIAAKSLLRHANIATTRAHYIKSVPAEAIRAVDKIDHLFDNQIVSGRPN